jgi:hypothetical protein
MLYIYLEDKINILAQDVRQKFTYHQPDRIGTMIFI